MQHEGASDQDIIQAFIKDYGPGIYRSAPSSAGWIVPYLALGFGGLIAIWYVRRLFRPKPALPELDPRVARYSDQIEKELSDLDR
jgi:cytochrome c-type biogenesis protein CcmH/NrfF